MGQCQKSCQYHGEIKDTIMDQNKLPTCWIPIVSQSRPLSYSWIDPIPAAFRICQKHLYCAIPFGRKSLVSQLFWGIIMVIAMNIQLSQLHQLLSRVSLSLLRSLDFSAFFEVGWPKSPQSPPCRSYQRPHLGLTHKAINSNRTNLGLDALETPDRFT